MPGSRQESRQENRLPLEESDCLDIYLLGDDFTLAAGRQECEVVNVSKHGLMIRCDSKLAAHTQFRLRFHFESGNELTLFGVIRWVVTEQDRFLIGLKIEDKLGTDYLLWQNRLNRLLLEQQHNRHGSQQLSA